MGKQIIEYVKNKYKFLNANERLLKIIFTSKLSIFGIYKYEIVDEIEREIFFIKLPVSFFDEYYSKYIYLYDNKEYYIWYKLHYESLILKKTSRILKRKVSKSKRRYIYNRDGNKCVLCSNNENLSLDHIYPLSKKIDESFYNLMTVCQKCNEKKGNKILSDDFIENSLIPIIKNKSL